MACEYGGVSAALIASNQEILFKIYWATSGTRKIWFCVWGCVSVVCDPQKPEKKKAVPGGMNRAR
jgi:hypothetical protein